MKVSIQKCNDATLHAENIATSGAVKLQAPQPDLDALHVELIAAMSSEIDSLKVDARKNLRRRQELIGLRSKLNDQ